MAEASESLTIMIVDDDELIRKVVTIYFGNRGHRVINAVSGQDCLEFAQRIQAEWSRKPHAGRAQNNR